MARSRRRRRGRKRLGGWVLVVCVALCAVFSNVIRARGYSNADQFFAELLHFVISWSWVAIVFAIVCIAFSLTREKKPDPYERGARSDDE